MRKLCVECNPNRLIVSDTRTCNEECKEILEELEKIDDDANKYGVEFVKNSERAASKKYGINEFPTLVYFRHGEPTVYQGDLKNEEEVLNWLISVESMDLPDRIEEVNAKILQNYIDEHDFVAVLFCKCRPRGCKSAPLTLPSHRQTKPQEE